MDASALAFFEEEEAKDLQVEYTLLARTATSHTVRLREVIQRMHVLRQKGRGRKKKKRRKKRLPRSPRPRPGPRCPASWSGYGPEGLYAASPWPRSSSTPAFACAVVVPVLRNDSAMVRQCRIPSWFRSALLPSFRQRQIPMVQTVQLTTEIPQMPFVFRWSMPLLCRFCASQVVSLRTQRTAWFDSGYMRCVSLWSFHIFYVYWLTLDPEVDSRPALFWHLLGFTVDASLCVRLRRPYFQRYAWFNSGYKFIRQITEAVFQRYAWFKQWIQVYASDYRGRISALLWHVQLQFAELTVVSFTVPLNGLTIVATATVVTSCSSSGVCVAMS